MDQVKTQSAPARNEEKDPIASKAMSLTSSSSRAPPSPSPNPSQKKKSFCKREALPLLFPSLIFIVIVNPRISLNSSPTVERPCMLLPYLVLFHHLGWHCIRNSWRGLCQAHSVGGSASWQLNCALFGPGHEWRLSKFVLTKSAISQRHGFHSRLGRYAQLSLMGSCFRRLISISDIACPSISHTYVLMCRLHGLR